MRNRTVPLPAFALSDFRASTPRAARRRVTCSFAAIRSVAVNAQVAAASPRKRTSSPRRRTALSVCWVGAESLVLA